MEEMRFRNEKDPSTRFTRATRCRSWVWRFRVLHGT
jgi:hypothetical protein